MSCAAFVRNMRNMCSIKPSGRGRQTAPVIRHGALYVLLSGVLFMPFMAAAGDTVFKSREPGNTTFSQYPPADAADKEYVKEIELAGDSGSVPVTRAGPYEYCGNLQLPPTMQSGEAATRGAIEANLSVWIDRHSELEASISSAVRNKNDSDNNYLAASAATKNQRAAEYRASLEKATRGLREYNCAIAWAESKLRDHDDGAVPELARLQAVRDKLLLQITEACGNQPPLDPSSAPGSHATAAWKHCVRPFDEKLDAIDEEIRRLPARL